MDCQSLSANKWQRQGFICLGVATNQFFSPFLTLPSEEDGDCVTSFLAISLCLAAWQHYLRCQVERALYLRENTHDSIHRTENIRIGQDCRDVSIPLFAERKPGVWVIKWTLVERSFDVGKTYIKAQHGQVCLRPWTLLDFPRLTFFLYKMGLNGEIMPHADGCYKAYIKSCMCEVFKPRSATYRGIWLISKHRLETQIRHPDFWLNSLPTAPQCWSLSLLLQRSCNHLTNLQSRLKYFAKMWMSAHFCNLRKWNKPPMVYPYHKIPQWEKNIEHKQRG